MTVTFGDLMLTSAEHLDTALASWKEETTAETTAAIIRGMHSTTQVLSWFTADITATAPMHSGVRPAVHPWLQAAVGAQSGLTLAVAALDKSIGQFGRLGSQLSGGAASHASQAAGLLAAARDLLQTNRVTSSSPGLVCSDWTESTNSLEITGALLTEIAEWSRWLATWLSQTWIADQPLPPGGRELRVHACRGLWTAAATIEMAGRQHPVSPTTKKLLHAVTSAMLPARHKPDGQEPIDELCEQARISAQRARAQARRAATQAHWSPSTTSDSWQWTAEASNIISHMTGLLLSNPGTQQALARTFPFSGTRIRAAGQAATQSCATWRQAAAAWDTVTTETQGLTSPVITDIGDLLLRIGRITFDNPAWTPALTQRAALRQPEELATSTTTLAAVITAVHEAADTLACVATADLQAIKLADRAHRLHTPTRYLPEEFDIPYPIGPATPDQVATVLAAYHAATTASTHATKMLEDLVLCIDAPSAPLATARKLTRLAETRPTHDPEYYNGGTLRGAVAGPARRIRPGPVEKALKNRGITDSLTLLQAAAIDHAARELIASSTHATSTNRSTPTRPPPEDDRPQVHIPPHEGHHQLSRDRGNRSSNGRTYRGAP